MFFLIFTLPFGSSQAGDASESIYYNESTGLQTIPVPEAEPVAEPPVRQQANPSDLVTGQVERAPRRVVEEEADPDLHVEGAPFDFTSISSRDLNTPILEPFKKLFQECAPTGCTAGEAQVCRGESCRQNSGSCHNSGEAMDLMSIKCNGRIRDAYTSEYIEFVTCARRQQVDSPSRENRMWKVLFREGESNRAGCGGVNAQTRSDKARACHWSHGHFSMSCRRNGRWSW